MSDIRVLPLGAAAGATLVEVRREERRAVVRLRCVDGSHTEYAFDQVETLTDRGAQGMSVARLTEHLTLGGKLPSRFVFENGDGSRTLAIAARPWQGAAVEGGSATRSWRALAASLFPDARFTSGAPAGELERIERELGVKPPAELTTLLAESDGLQGNYSTPLVWSSAEIIRQNLEFRRNRDFAELYMPFDCLLLFGDGGNGDHFAYRILEHAIPPIAGIFKWDHENDSRSWFAADLEDYLRRSVPHGSAR